jgi:broad specificity phosphatase PhoE
LNRLLLVRHASTPATRRAAFPLDEGLDAAGARQAAALSRPLTGADRVLVAPAAAAQETATAAGLAWQAEPALALADYGGWTGLSLEQVHAQDPDGLDAWRRNPRARPHGGECLDDLVERMRAFLRRAQSWPGRTVAITDGAVIKAALVSTLGAPASSCWLIDIAPGSITELHVSGDGDTAWRVVRANWTPPRSGPAGQDPPDN